MMSATLKHLAREGTGENSLRALASDLAYLEAWARVAIGAALPWPARKASRLNSRRIVCGTRPNARLIRSTACQPTWRRSCGTPGCFAATARMRRRRSSDDWRAGAPCVVEREGGAVPLTQSALRAPTGGPGQHPATAAEQQAGGHPRCTRSSPLYLPVGPAGRYPRSRHPAAGLRFAAARWLGCGSSSSATKRRARSPRPQIREVAVFGHSARPHQDWRSG